MDVAELFFPIGLRLFAAQVVQRDIAEPDGIVEVESGANLFQPAVERMLLRGFLLQHDELIVGLRQRLDQLAPRRVGGLPALDAVDEDARVPALVGFAVGARLAKRLVDKPGARHGESVQLG